ncbi:hypothetical protein [Pandoraea sp. 64-18]|uniref:hypothetical protein n=1 Tax=Pandoraea sp. 64-18 TaxID=1895806 RepID=UPI000959CFCA|nr:hypothetical protein [Pandoraea sp. 64-18]OJY20756.1 MAG: hypothetical protein BGP02_09895 [Pandoraea sp. 64-18]
MKLEYWVIGLIGLAYVDARRRAQQANATPLAFNNSVTDSIYAGSNFTNSIWDAASGQPGYQWGSISAPSTNGTYEDLFGMSVMGFPMQPSIGHLS